MNWRAKSKYEWRMPITVAVCFLGFFFFFFTCYLFRWPQKRQNQNELTVVVSKTLREVQLSGKKTWEVPPPTNVRKITETFFLFFFSSNSAQGQNWLHHFSLVAQAHKTLSEKLILFNRKTIKRILLCKDWGYNPRRFFPLTFLLST